MSVNLEIVGKIHHVADTVFVTDKFQKREFVVHIADQNNPKYDDYVQLQMTMDNCDKLDNVKFGDEVKLQVNLRGREYERKDGSGKAYFNSLDAWKIETLNNGVQTPPAPTPPTPPPPVEHGDDLPF